jgi:hypothetical protein
MPNREGRRWRVRISRWDEFIARDVPGATKEEAEEYVREVYGTPRDLEPIDGGFHLIEAEPEEE